MKIERINENQIRCTLTSSDLSARNLNLGELAYGTEKAKKLFHEMIQKASNEVGFEADDIPLMVEAIPLSSESIMLIITKIEDPEVCAGNRIQAGNYFSGSGSAVYDGRCLLMNETARKLMKRIDDASFAMDDVILYLDTHPDDRNALNYYRYVVALRKEAVKAYEASFGPLTIEDADDACTWSWLTERWPWEGEV